jgi:hypothetical protein
LTSNGDLNGNNIQMENIRGCEMLEEKTKRMMQMTGCEDDEGSQK